MKQKRIIFSLILFLLLGTCAKSAELGTTFSKKQCDYFGLDEKETFLEVLRMDFDVIRLAAYWDEIEKEEGVFDFSSLDWQIKKARERKIPVVLTVGMKAPRWPEYYIPSWVLEKADLPYGSDVAGDPFLKEKALLFIKRTAERYKGEKIIILWQVENEAFTRIGKEAWYIGKEFLQEEVDLVRSIVRGKEILLTSATYPNRLLRFATRLVSPYNFIKDYIPMAGTIGLNVYPTVGEKKWGMDFYIRTTPEERKRYFTEEIKKLKENGKKVWVTELQAEPWEPGHLVYKPEEEPKTSSPLETYEAFTELKDEGVEVFLFWGVEYWVYRKKNYNDDRWYELLKRIKEERE